MSSTEPSSGGFNSIRVLVPGTGTRFRCGGLSVALQTARLLSTLRPTDVVTYRERSDGHPYLDDVLQAEQSPGKSLWIVSWGFDVPRSLMRLRGRPVVYQAHSSGYGFGLPPGVPVVAVSRNTLGYWGDRAPRNPLFWVPNALEPQWLERGARPLSSDRDAVAERPIDVLVQKRKSSPYVLEQLVPALQAEGLKVEVQSGWVDDLVDLFNRSKIYLYDSAEYWRGRGVSEGFGLPPLEALACGCVLFSSFNHALADTLTRPLACPVGARTNTQTTSTSAPVSLAIEHMPIPVSGDETPRCLVCWQARGKSTDVTRGKRGCDKRKTRM